MTKAQEYYIVIINELRQMFKYRVTAIDDKQMDLVRRETLAFSHKLKEILDDPV